MVNGKQISQITSLGIRYFDEDNVEQFIDFEQCTQNYINQQLNPEKWKHLKRVNNLTDADWDMYVERTKRIKIVGNRNILTLPWADGPYIELNSNPPIRFKFDTEDEYSEVIEAIELTQYKTFDLS